MNQSRNRYLALVVLAAALIAGGSAYAASKLHGSSSPGSAGTFSANAAGSYGGGRGFGGGGPGGGFPGRGGGGDLAAAATYLGVSQSDLFTSLRSGKTLAQIAGATSGKSVAGLIDTLVAAQKAQLAAAVSAGQFTQAQADQIASGLTARVTAEVNGTRSARGPGGFGGRGFGGGDDGGTPTPGTTPASPGSGTHI
jgi:hypothetical protein